MIRTPHDRPTRTRRTRPSVRMLALVLPIALAVTGCATDDDEPVADTAADTMVGDTMVEDMGPDSEAVDLLTDTLAGAGVDTFLTLLPLVGFDEVTEADQITIFAPSDEAFTSVAADELAAIVDDPQSVIDVLQAHVVEGAVPASDLEQLSSVQPIRGEEIPVSVDGDTITVGEATVVEADVEFEGGVVHVIDDVLLLDEL